VSGIEHARVAQIRLADIAISFFFRNWEAVATTANDTGRRTFFLDWLGMGLSSRPSPKLLDSPSSVETPARVARAEHFFLSSLESWRASVGLEKMVLVGHSLGGYLASAYTARYPDRVSALILVSPAGIPHGPEYKRYQTSAELAAGKTRTVGVNADGAGVGEGREEAAEAVEAELNKTQPEAKGEAKQWQKDQTLTRKYMMKCEYGCPSPEVSMLTWRFSLRLGLGEGFIPVLDPSSKYESSTYLNLES
jgi:cardiolipin-specific phospholipase